jgi:putative nucleotidyltransferase with HDIG domain
MTEKASKNHFFDSIRRSIKIAYLIASIIPLLSIVYLSVKYIYPYIKETEGEFFASVGIILVFTVILSVLGYILSVNTTNKALTSTQNAYTKLNSLLEVTKHFRDSLYIDVLLESIVKSATELIDAEAGSLLLVDDEGGLWFKVALGDAGKKLKDKAVKPGEGITGWVFDTGKSAIINNVENDERFSPHLDAETGFKTSSILSIPLIYEKQTIGVLEVLNKKSGAFSQIDENLLFSLADQASISISQSRSRESQHADMIQMIDIIINALDHHTPMKKGHAKRVAMYANAIGKELNLDEDELRKLYFAAVLHDIGLLRFEYHEHKDKKKFKKHSEIGYEMIRPISAWKDIAHIILFHHERYDGKGYPTEKKGNEIPLNSRIISVADTFDVLTSKNSYREQIPVKDAIKEIEIHAGMQFDPDIVTAFKNAVTKINV